MYKVRFSLTTVIFSFLFAVAAAAQEPGGAVISTICVDAETGLVLAAENADVVRPPASMIKLMVLLLANEGIEAGDWNLTTPITASQHAQHMGGTQVHLAAGETWPLGKLLEAVAIASANDAAMAVAEGLWGSKAACLVAMNERARQLDMDSTIFRSVHGLPPDPGELPDATTARDMSKLARACVQVPQLMSWCGRREFAFRPDAPPHYSTNKLLWRMPGCDGLKTGFIRAAGFCVTATAQRDGVRLITVVMGHPTPYGRFNLAQETLETAFSAIVREAVVSGGETLDEKVPVFDGARADVAVTPARDLWATVPAADRKRVEIVQLSTPDIRAPLEAGARVGDLVIRLDGTELGRTALLTAESVGPAGWRLTLRDGRARWEGLDRDASLN